MGKFHEDIVAPKKGKGKGRGAEISALVFALCWIPSINLLISSTECFLMLSANQWEITSMIRDRFKVARSKCCRRLPVPRTVRRNFICAE